MRGLGRVFKRGSVWWVSYYHRGNEYRESSSSEREAQALRLLKKRLGEINAGKFIGPSEDRWTFDDMVDDLKNDYRVNNRRSLSTAEYHVRHLRGFFGLDRAIDITPDRVKAYQVHRLDEGGSPATVNREVACLGHMLSLAVNSGKLSRKPKFKLLEGEKVRQGFLEHGDFLTLLSNLPDHLKPVTEFLYLSGWRKGEALKLEWRDIDMEGKAARLRIENSKNKESRVLPLTGKLFTIIQQGMKQRRLDCPFVFHHKGEHIGEFRKSWKRACRMSGLEGVLVHDLRRCAARNLSRAGVQREVAMQITGHKTESMYRRYRIVDEKDLREAAEKLQSHLESQDETKVVPLRANQ
jgi:integrase